MLTRAARRTSLGVLGLVFLCALSAIACAQAPAARARDARPHPARGSAQDPLANERPQIARPGLLFAEDWKQTSKGGEHPVTAESNGNPDLDVKLYVPKGEILMTGADGDENVPTHLWTGLCETPCAVAFRDKGHFADLRGFARIRFNTKMSGLHEIRPIVKLADGTWWLGDRATGRPGDWLVSEISLADLRWIKLDIKRVVTVGNLVDKIDLAKVDEIGFADLMPGSGHGPGGWADVAQVEVYGRAVSR